jgi:hypothetical protein
MGMSNVIDFRRTADRDRRTIADKAVFMDFDNWHVINHGWPEIELKRWDAVMKPVGGGWQWAVKLRGQDDEMWGDDVFD